MNINTKTDNPSERSQTTLTTGSVPSCLRNRNDPLRKQPLDRRVSFPENDHHMVTGYFEPANPWEYADNVSRDDLVSKYISSCEKHGARPISRLVNQLQCLNYDQDRSESLDLEGEMLGPSACETLEEILKRIQFLTINLEGTNIDDESSVALFDMMEYYESAVRLNITGNHCIAARGWQACSRMIKRTKCLEELDARNTTLNEQYMPILSRALRLSTQLHVLKLENCNLSGRPLVILAAALKLNTGLKELYLGENYLMQNDAQQLSALLKVNTVLQLLDISNNNVQDEGLGHIVEGLLEQNSSGGGLQVLVLWNNHLSRCCGHHLSRIFSAVTSLETINIGQNVLSNDVLHVNKLPLQKNRTLLRLGMQSTHLSCEGAVALAEIIADNPSIQRIDLRDNNLQVAGLMALVLSMRVNQSVTQLDLDDTPRRKHSMGPALDEYMRLVTEIRGHCQTNSKRMEKDEDFIETVIKEEETMVPNIERRSRAGSFATRKISLTCETLARSHTIPAPACEPNQLLTEPRRSGGRLRSPAPSPIPSPVASPSPTRSRFQVSRVTESDSPVTPPSSSPNVFFGSASRFKVTMVESGNPKIPTTVLSSNNVTVGFEASSTLSPNVSISPAPSPTPIPAPLLSSIPSLFPTPMPSPMPSPLVSPAPSPTYISPLSTINVGEAHSISPVQEKSFQKDQHNLPQKTVEAKNTVQVPIIINDIDGERASELMSNLTTCEPINVKLESNKNIDKDNYKCETIFEELPAVPTSSNSSVYLDHLDTSDNSTKFSPRNSVSPPKVSKSRSESEESDKDLYTNRKLPKATDSLDLSVLRVMKQASVSVPEKSSAPVQRVRKISSWVQPGAMFSAITQEDSGKAGSSLERLLGLFTNPFSRSKADEETTQQLKCVPEVAETTALKSDVFEQTCKNVETVLKSKEKESDILPSQFSENVQSKSNNDVAINYRDSLTNDSIKDNLGCESDDKHFNSCKSNKCSIESCSTSNGCEPHCDKKGVSIPFILNSKNGLSETEIDGIKCETWPQGTSMNHPYLIQQAQSHSSPCLTALVFLKGNVTANLEEMQKISSPAGEDTVESNKNISLAL